jgi:hypothetical protein
MPVSSPDLNGKLAGAGLLMAASMHAGAVMLAGDSVREACGKLGSGVTARSAQNFSAGRPDPRLPTTIGLSQPLAALPLRQDGAVRPGAKARR